MVVSNLRLTLFGYFVFTSLLMLYFGDYAD